MPRRSVAACILHAGLGVCATGPERRSRCSSRSLHRFQAAGSPIIATRSRASCGSMASATVAHRSHMRLPVKSGPNVAIRSGSQPVGWHEIAGDMPDPNTNMVVIVCGEGDQALFKADGNKPELAGHVRRAAKDQQRARRRRRELRPRPQSVRSVRHHVRCRLCERSHRQSGELRSSSEFCQQPAVAGDAVADAGKTQRIPDRRL